MLKRSLSNKEFLVRIFIGVIVICSVYSCEKNDTIKEELIGRKLEMAGTWHWIYSDHYYGWCDGDSWFEQLTSATEGEQFRIEVFTVGIIQFYKNDSLINQSRIFWKYFEENSDDCILLNANFFNVDLNNFENLDLNGCFNNDTMWTTAFPGFLYSAETGCESYTNYFIKE